MKPMISPWTIYFASRADAVGTLFLIVAVAAFAICLIGFDDLTKNGFKLFISIGIISVILTVLTPTTETVYTMMVANELTSDNVQAIGKTGKDVIDYITDQIDKVVNDKEEDKNNGYLSNSVKRYLQTSTPQYVSRGLTKLVSYWTPRRSMLKEQDHMVFFGLQAFIKEYLITYFKRDFFKLSTDEVQELYTISMDIQLEKEITIFLQSLNFTN